MRILLTGGSGFIGTNLVNRLLARRCEVINFDMNPPRNSTHSRIWRRVDVRDRASLISAVREFSPNIIVHAAARTDLNGESLKDYSANVEGVGHLVDAMEGLSSLDRVIFLSSRLVCRIGYQPEGDLDYCPTTRYGESKVLGEKIVRENARRIPCAWTIVRPTSIWGPWFDVPYKNFFLAVARGMYFHPKGRAILKSFGYVENTVYQLERLMEAGEGEINQRTFYLADYPPIRVEEMAESIRVACNAPPVKSLGMGALRALAKAGDALKQIGWRNPPLTTFRLNNLVTDMVYDLEPLRQVVGELPISTEEGIRRTVSWLREAGEIH